MTALSLGPFSFLVFGKICILSKNREKMISIFHILEEVFTKGSTDVTRMTNGLNTPHNSLFVYDSCSYRECGLNSN